MLSSSLMYQPQPQPQYNNKNLKLYHLEILELCKYNNNIIYLPNGIGIHHIIVELIEFKIKFNKQIIYLVNSPYQMIEISYLLKKNTKLNIGLFIDHDNKETSIYNNENLLKYDIIVATGIWCLNMLSNRYISLLNISMIVFDEVQYCQNNHEYALIIKSFIDPLSINERPHMIGVLSSFSGELSIEKTTITLFKVCRIFNSKVITPSSVESIQAVASDIILPQIVKVPIRRPVYLDSVLKLIVNLIFCILEHFSPSNWNIYLRNSLNNFDSNEDIQHVKKIAIIFCENCPKNSQNLIFELLKLFDLYVECIDIDTGVSMLNTLAKFFYRIAVFSITFNSVAIFNKVVEAHNIKLFEACCNTIIANISIAMKDPPKLAELQNLLKHLNTERGQYLDKFGDGEERDRIAIFVRSPSIANQVYKIAKSVSPAFKPIVLSERGPLDIEYSLFEYETTFPKTFLENLVKIDNLISNMNSKLSDYIDNNKLIDPLRYVIEDHEVSDIDANLEAMKSEVFSIYVEPKKEDLISIFKDFDLCNRTAEIVESDPNVIVIPKSKSRPKKLSPKPPRNYAEVMKHSSIVNEITYAPNPFADKDHIEFSRFPERFYSTDLQDHSHNVFIFNAALEKAFDINFFNVIVRLDMDSSYDLMLSSRGCPPGFASTCIAILEPSPKDSSILKDYELREKNLIITIDAMTSGKLSVNNQLNELNVDFIKKYDAKSLLQNWLFKKLDVPFDLNFEIGVVRYLTNQIPNYDNSCNFETSLYLPKAIGLEDALLMVSSNTHPTSVDSENFAAYMGLVRLFTTGLINYDNDDGFLVVEGLEQFDDKTFSNLKNSHIEKHEASKFNYIGKLNEWVTRFDDLTLVFSMDSIGPRHDLQYTCNCELFRIKGADFEDSAPGIKFIGEKSRTKQDAKMKACAEMLTFVLSDTFNKGHAKILNYVPVDEKLKNVSREFMVDSQPPPTENAICFIYEFIQAHPTQGFAVKFEFLPITGPAHCPIIKCVCTFSNKEGILYLESANGKNKSEAKTSAATKVRSLILKDKASYIVT